MKTNIVKIRVHAGGGWEGHVVYTAINPNNESELWMSSNIEEVKIFCEKHNLVMDENFESLVKQFLQFNSKYGYIVPLQYIDEYKPISSCSSYLKKTFSDYS